jgi:hypothetical protein
LVCFRHLVYFFLFWYVVPRKIWQPWLVVFWLTNRQHWIKAIHINQDFHNIFAGKQLGPFRTLSKFWLLAIISTYVATKNCTNWRLTFSARVGIRRGRRVSGIARSSLEVGCRTWTAWTRCRATSLHWYWKVFWKRVAGRKKNRR